MKIKIHRKYFRNEYLFYITTTFKSNECTVRQLCTDEEIHALISKDFKKIMLSKGIKIDGIDGEKSKIISHLKVPKHYLSHIKNELNGD